MLTGPLEAALGICRLGTWMPVTSAAGSRSGPAGVNSASVIFRASAVGHADVVHGERVELQSGDPKAGRRQLDVVDLDAAEARPTQVQIGQGVTCQP